MSKFRGRKPTATDRTRNDRAYQVTGTWPGSGRPARFHVHDLARARRRAQEWAADGATVVIEESGRHGVWRTLRTYQPTNHREGEGQ